MLKDKYSATWISYSSISDYLKCPRAYFLKNVYKNPKNLHKITLMQPALALGQIVHAVLEKISTQPKESRFSRSLIIEFHQSWLSITGKKGGFRSQDEEEKYKERGVRMLERVQKNPGPINNQAVKLRQQLPYYWLSESDNIILCGRIDWLEFLPETNSLHLIDFKTGKSDEDEYSLQLLIYYLLVKNCQPRSISKLSYWYLDRDDQPMSMKIPDEKKAEKVLMEIGRKIALARKLEHFTCSKKSGCFACLPYEKILNGEAELTGIDVADRDVYVLP